MFGPTRIAEDWTDLRDFVYAPSLATLPHTLWPPNEVFSVKEAGEISPTFGVPDQGETGQCAGFALANLVDVQRRIQAAHSENQPVIEGRVSAQMLYHLAQFHDLYSAQHSVPEIEPAASALAKDGVRSLRSAVKALYNYGVFVEGSAAGLNWAEEQIEPTLLQLKSARSLSLGVYYRLHAVLNHYHAAVHETGTVLFSARIHKGWSHESVAQNSGRIVFENNGLAGLHAAVVIGYTSEGFLVLNSAGPDWGGYEGFKGVALWPYEDWARSIRDAWVLRLSVPTPGAFSVSLGDCQNQRSEARAARGSIPANDLIGHYVHLDDGSLVEHSVYPTTPGLVEQTIQSLGQCLSRDRYVPGETRYKGIVIWLCGAFDGIDHVFETSARRKRKAQEIGLAPLFVFWGNDFVTAGGNFLRTTTHASAEKTGAGSQHQNLVIENTIRGPGRAFWREIKSGARKSIWATGSDDDVIRGDSPGVLADILLRINSLLGPLGCEIHIVTEGAGALVLDELLRFFGKLALQDKRTLMRRLTSITVSLPTIRLDQSQKRITRIMELLNKTARAREFSRTSLWIQPASVLLPTVELEERLSFGSYTQSLSTLIARAFEDGDANGPNASYVQLLGMASTPAVYVRDRRNADIFKPIEDFSPKRINAGKVDQANLFHDPGLEETIFETMQKRSQIREILVQEA